MNIGKQVKTWRAKREMTQVQLAKEAKLMQKQISEIETGYRMPSLSTVLKIAQALGVSLVFVEKTSKNRKKRGQ